MDGAFGLKKIEELRPDVVTLDLEMPRMDGLETLRHITRQLPYTGDRGERVDDRWRQSQRLKPWRWEHLILSPNRATLLPPIWTRSRWT